ncbi:MAG: hypothetical protein ACP5NZ_04640 [Nanobdellota archaeon]
MQTRIVYTAESANPRINHIANINESVERLIKRLGGLVMNSAYILNEGLPSEAYGYYMFPRLGLIKTSLKMEDNEYILSVSFYGFESESDKEKYAKLKIYIEDTLKKVLY